MSYILFIYSIYSTTCCIQYYFCLSPSAFGRLKCPLVLCLIPWLVECRHLWTKLVAPDGPYCGLAMSGRLQSVRRVLVQVTHVHKLRWRSFLVLHNERVSSIASLFSMLKIPFMFYFCLTITCAPIPVVRCYLVTAHSVKVWNVDGIIKR